MSLGGALKKKVAELEAQLAGTKRLLDAATEETGIERQRTLKEYNKRKIAEAKLDAEIDFQRKHLLKRIAELEQEVKDAFYDGRDARERAEKAEAKLDAVRDALKDHEDWKFSAKSTIRAIKKALNGENDG